MRPASWILCVSLAANVGLVAAWSLHGRSSSSSTSPEAATGVQSEASSASSAALGKRGSIAASASSTSATDDRLSAIWKQLDSADLPTLIARLRHAGFSPQFIRAIVTARVNEQFADRFKAISGEQKTVEFWKVSQGRYGVEVAKMGKMASLYRERAKLLKELLGSDEGSDQIRSEHEARRYGYLSSEKAEQIQLIQQDYRELKQLLQNEMRVFSLPSDREKLAYLEAEQAKDLATLLTPEELNEYSIRTSMTSFNVRTQLDGLDISEAQFRQVYALQKAFDDQFGATRVSSASATPERSAAQAALVAQVKEILGEDAGTTYGLMAETSYRSAVALAARLNLPKETALQSEQVRRQYQSAVEKVKKDSQLSPTQRIKALNSLGEQAKNDIARLYGGPGGLEAYRKNGGYWIMTTQTISFAPGAK